MKYIFRIVFVIALTLIGLTTLVLSFLWHLNGSRALDDTDATLLYIATSKIKNFTYD